MWNNVGTSIQALMQAGRGCKPSRTDIALYKKATMIMDDTALEFNNTDLNAEWDFIGQQFPLPHDAGTGCMLIVPLAQGGSIYYSEYRLFKDCVVESKASPEDLSELLCTQVLLSGSIILEPPCGNRQPQDTEKALLYRVKDQGSRIWLPGNQIVRHVGVAVPLSSEVLQAEAVKRLIKPFQELEKGHLVATFALQKTTRKWAAELFRHASDTSAPTAELQREGLARCYLSSLLSDYAQLQHSASDTSGQPTAWEVKNMELVCAHIDASLDQALNFQSLTTRFGFSRYRLNELFNLLHGQTLRDYVRQRRLCKAKQLIELDGMPVKVAAFSVGYRHVSNFTRAYREYFGCTPGCSSQGRLGEN